ncbi:hypothetical protein [Escherichia coli]|uniref:hypothetical protein n=1 Tax=Escherichia coli TaxID=562 RepID=UPI001F4BA977|nr:hypothetical protein [Escherichia coli]
MWLLIFWLSSPFNVSSGDARQPTLAVHSQAFHTERACRDALHAINGHSPYMLQQPRLTKIWP